MTFWDHLEELRGCLIRILVAVVVFGVAAFCFKDVLFDIVLAPKESDFVTYRLLERLVGKLPEFSVAMININLAQQFIIHLKVAMCVGALVVMPYILFEVFRFISPALYRSERKVAIVATVCGFVVFMLGVLLNYFVIFPLTFRFLGSYQVSSEVVNQPSLESYIGMLLMLSILMGILFELPIVSWILAKVGLLTGAMMRKVRKYAIVVVLVLSAIITPSGDAFTLLLVALPVYVLYEVSILVVKRTEKRLLKLKS